MRKHKTSALFVALIGLSFAGCADSADSLALRQVDNYNKLADALEADKPTADLDALNKRIKDTNERMESLSESEKRRVAEKYAPELAKALQRVMAATLQKAGGALGDAMKNLMPGIEDSKRPVPEPKK